MSTRASAHPRGYANDLPSKPEAVGFTEHRRYLLQSRTMGRTILRVWRCPSFLLRIRLYGYLMPAARSWQFTGSWYCEGKVAPARLIGIDWPPDTLDCSGIAPTPRFTLLAPTACYRG